MRNKGGVQDWSVRTWWYNNATLWVTLWLAWNADWEQDTMVWEAHQSLLYWSSCDCLCSVRAGRMTSAMPMGWMCMDKDWCSHREVPAGVCLAVVLGTELWLFILLCYEMKMAAPELPSMGGQADILGTQSPHQSPILAKHRLYQQDLPSVV